MVSERIRAIGPLGTICRVGVGVGLFVLASLDGLHWNEVGLGLVGLPAALLLAQLVRLRIDGTPLRATGPMGFSLNCAILTIMLITPVLSDATQIWLGASMLLAAWRGYAGCESLAISNWLLRRDDQVGCVIFAPVDALEAQRVGHAGR